MAGLNLNPGEKDIFKIVQTIRQLMEGKTNSIVTATLNANATTTTVTAPTCSTSSASIPSPQTPAAGNDMATMSFAPAMGQFVITHANNARVDRTFIFVVLG